MGTRNRVGIGLSHRPARLHKLAESIRGLHKSFKISSLEFYNNLWGLGTEQDRVVVPARQATQAGEQVRQLGSYSVPHRLF
jgi:hypothetical protein